MPTRVALVALAGVVLAGPAAAQAIPNGPGTLQVGDRVWLHVEGEGQLSDTFTVTEGLVITLPVIGDIALSGVLRARIEEHLTRELARYVKNPVIRARALVRIAIEGEVARPGFYPVPTDLVLADAIMLAGGATPDGRISDMRIERGRRRLFKPADLERVMARGLTLDQLDLRAGDRIVVPARGGFESTARVIGILAAVPVAIFAIVQMVP